MRVDVEHCSVCATPLSAGVARGLCPTCLLQQGLMEDTGVGRSSAEPGSGALGASAGHSNSGAPRTSLSARSARGMLRLIDQTLAGAPRIRLSGDAAEDASPLGSSPAVPDACYESDASHVELLGEIAHGGMGTILRGRDLDLGRELAVKVLKDKHAGKPELIRRFIEEAQIAGQLQHPGIAPIYELGLFSDLRPFFTMKLVKGETLAALLHARTDAGHDLPRMLIIFEQVCQTMAYAHDRGVVHRDLKPANIMVGRFGEVQVMDWGLAKVLCTQAIRSENGDLPAESHEPMHTLRTQAGAGFSLPGRVLGTPAYIAPEQARGESEHIDARSDVFGLGAILCEILTGSPPYSGHGTDDALKQAMAGDLSEAQSRLAACGADPELKCLAAACLSAEPARRPLDANVVARRMTTYLRGVQDRLHQAELDAVRARAKAARLRYAAAAIAAILLLLVGGVITFYTLERQARGRQARFESALGTAEQVRRGLADEATRRIVGAAEWDQAGAAADAAAGLMPAHAPESWQFRLTGLRTQIRQAGAAAVLDGHLIDELQVVRASKSAFVEPDIDYAEVFLRYGDDLRGEDLAAAWQKWRSRPRPVRQELAAALDDWALVRFERHGEPGPEPLLALAQSMDADPWRSELRRVMIEKDLRARRERLLRMAAEADPMRLSAQSITLLAACLGGTHEHPAAIGLLKRSLGRHAQDVWVNHLLGTQLLDLRPVPREEALRFLTAARALRPETGFELAATLRNLGRLDEAKMVVEDLATRAPDSWLYLTALAQLEGATERGHRLARQAVELTRARVERMPNDAWRHFDLGEALGEAGDTAEAARAYAETLRINPDHPFAHAKLAGALLKSGDVDRALAEYGEAIRLDSGNAMFHLERGATLMNHGRPSQAIDDFKAALRIQPDDCRTHLWLAEGYRQTGNETAAQAEFREALRLDPGATTPATGPASSPAAGDDRKASTIEAARWLQLGIERLRAGQLLQSEEALREALRLQPDDPGANYILGHVYKRLDRLPDARKAFRAAFSADEHQVRARDEYVLASAQLAGGSTINAWLDVALLHPDSTTTARALLAALNDEGRLADAGRLCRETVPETPANAPLFRCLGAAFYQLGRDADAADSLHMALKLEPKEAAACAFLGFTESVQGHREPAAEWFRRAVQLKPADSEVTEPFLLQLAQHDRHLHGPAADLFLTSKETSTQSEQFRAILLLAVGHDQDAYARICRRLIEAHENSNDAGAAEQVARICGVSPRSPVAAERIVRLARRAMELGSQGGWTHYTLGLACYRAGQYEEALRSLEESLKTKNEWSASALNFPVLAMTHHRLAHPDQAGQYLEKAKSATIASEPFWNDPLELRLLVDEACSIVK